MSLAVLTGVKAASTTYSSYKIITTSHSLGAATATLGAAYLRRAGHTVDVYTYGSPRVGNGALTNLLQNKRAPDTALRTPPT